MTHKISPYFFQSYNLPELQFLRRLLNEKLYEQKQAAKKKTEAIILEEVKQNGFAWNIKPIITINSPDIIATQFPASVYVYEDDQKYKREKIIRVHGLTGGNDWVEYMKFTYNPTDKDHWEVPKNSQMWDHGDWGDPYSATGSMPVQVFFKRHDVPSGTSFRYFDQDGNIQQMNIVNGNLIDKDINEVGTVEEWNTYNFMVVT